MEKILKVYLIFGGVYFIFDGLLHLSGIKLASVVNSWPRSALVYAKLVNYLYASFIILSGTMALFLQSDLKKYHSLVVISGIWAFFHGVILLFLITTAGYGQIFKGFDSLLVYLPFYEGYLTLNALLLFSFSMLVYFWRRKKR